MATTTQYQTWQQRRRNIKHGNNDDAISNMTTTTQYQTWQQLHNIKHGNNDTISNTVTTTQYQTR